MIRLKYGVKFCQLNVLYNMVFLPVISYGARAWQHRMNHIVRKIREAQRRVLISITAAYRMTSLQALCAVTANMPIHIKLTMDLEIWMPRRD